MKFLNLFKSKPKPTGVIGTVEVVAGPRNPPDQLPPFVVRDGDDLLNLLPYAAEVLADYPEPVPLTPEQLADLTARGWDGKYIKVAEYPPAIPRDLVQQMMNRTSKWARWSRQYRSAQRVADAFPANELRVGATCCARARKLSEYPSSPEEIERMPLNGCWEPDCQCRWRPLTARALRSKG